jgi:hypothetical protein
MTVRWRPGPTGSTFDPVIQQWPLLLVINVVNLLVVCNSKRLRTWLDGVRCRCHRFRTPSLGIARSRARLCFVFIVFGMVMAEVAGMMTLVAISDVVCINSSLEGPTERLCSVGLAFPPISVVECLTIVAWLRFLPKADNYTRDFFMHVSQSLQCLPPNPAHTPASLRRFHIAGAMSVES